MTPSIVLCRIVSHDTITACKNSTLDAVFDCVTEGPAQIRKLIPNRSCTLRVSKELCPIVSYFFSDTMNAYKNSSLGAFLNCVIWSLSKLFWAKKREKTSFLSPRQNGHKTEQNHGLDTKNRINCVDLPYGEIKREKKINIIHGIYTHRHNDTIYIYIFFIYKYLFLLVFFPRIVSPKSGDTKVTQFIKPPFSLG